MGVRVSGYRDEGESYLVQHHLNDRVEVLVPIGNLSGVPAVDKRSWQDGAITGANRSTNGESESTWGVNRIVERLRVPLELLCIGPWSCFVANPDFSWGQGRVISHV